jgi:hypothetical protein
VNQEDTLRSDIHRALDPITGSTPDLMPAIGQRLRPVSRRRPLMAIGQVAAVLGIGLVVGGVVFATHRARVTPARVTTSPTTPIVAGPGANIAWVPSQQAGGGFYSGDVITGVDPTGRLVGTINARDELRSPDGSHLYALVDGGLDVYSAVDGHKEQTIHLQPVNYGQPMLSADGHYFAVAGNSPSSLQLVDLLTGRVVASTNGGLPSGAPVIVGAQAQHVYVVGATVAKFSFDGTTLRLEQSTTGHTLACDGLVVGGGNSAGGLPFRVLADGRTLVAFCPGDGRVTWFDLVAMKVTHEVQIGQRNPFWVSPVFSGDGKMLYLHEGGTGALHAIDLVQRKIVTSTKVAAADTNPLAWLRSLLVTDADAGGIPRTAAVSPDGTWLYAVGIFGAPGGVSLVHLPDLAVKGRWQPTVGLNSVWVSADGRTIYLLGADDQLRVLRTDGSLIAKVALPANASGFIVPTIP